MYKRQDMKNKREMYSTTSKAKTGLMAKKNLLTATLSSWISTMDYRSESREGLSISLPNIFPKTAHSGQAGHGARVMAARPSMDLILWSIQQFHSVRIRSCMPLVAGTSGIQMRMLFQEVALRMGTCLLYTSKILW